MKLTLPISTCRSVKAALAMVAVMALTCVVNATPVGFTEDFTAPIDPAWMAAGYAPGHLGPSGGQYGITTVQGEGVKLQRFDTGDVNPLLSYTHEITVNFDTFFLTGSGGTQSDFKLKNFGSDGFMELVLNSFGDMRLFHGGNGNIQPNTNIGISEGDALGLKTVYNAGTDTIDVTYSLNGGADIPFYSGGSGGSIGNVIGNFVEVELYKWGAAVDVPLVGLDEWNLTVVPEPATLGLFGLGTLGFLFVRRFLV